MNGQPSVRQRATGRRGVTQLARVMTLVDLGLILALLSLFSIIHIATTYVLSLIPGVQRYVTRPALNKEYIWRKYFYNRIRDCWNRKVTSRAGIWLDVCYDTEDTVTGKRQSAKGVKAQVNENTNVRRCLNFGSYNYLGFADSPLNILKDDMECLDRYGNSTATIYTQVGGLTEVHRELETRIARYVGKESAFVFSMGFATNSTAIPLLVPPGSLILSDSMNHSSIVTGCRCCAEYKIAVFEHNNIAMLEALLRRAVVQNAYTSIVVFVEGVYSMEGDICDLPAIVGLKRKYKFWLYVDEAHSIGALGQHGKGVKDYFEAELLERFATTDVIDVMMGTFTKSFASIGGYIAGDRDVIERVRCNWNDGISMPPMCAQQVVSAIDEIEHDRSRIEQLRENTDYLRERLTEMGLEVLGNDGSPVIPILVRNPLKMAYISRELLKYNIGIVVVGYPAVPVVENRIRLCVSSALTRRDIDYALSIFRMCMK